MIHLRVPDPRRKGWITTGYYVIPYHTDVKMLHRVILPSGGIVSDFK